MSTLAAIKNSSRNSVMKVYGTPGIVTINLATDILSHKQVINPAKPQSATIREMIWTCDVGGKITITRGTEQIAVLVGAGTIGFAEGFTDNIADTEDIVVEISGANAALWISLNKDGYLNTIETTQFSVYDNPNVAGA